MVGQYANGRAPATTDVANPGTAGSMTYNFPAAGSYPLVLDYFENSGGEEIEFFQTDATGGNQRLINVDSEVTVYRSAMELITAFAPAAVGLRHEEPVTASTNAAAQVVHMTGLLMR